jgi:hypothetical protein
MVAPVLTAEKVEHCGLNTDSLDDHDAIVMTAGFLPKQTSLGRIKDCRRSPKCLLDYPHLRTFVPLSRVRTVR